MEDYIKQCLIFTSSIEGLKDFIDFEAMKANRLIEENVNVENNTFALNERILPATKALRNVETLHHLFEFLNNKEAV